MASQAQTDALPPGPRPDLLPISDLVITGPTGTNVADLWAIAIGAAAAETRQAGRP